MTIEDQLVAAGRRLEDELRVEAADPGPIIRRRRRSRASMALGTVLAVAIAISVIVVRGPGGSVQLSTTSQPGLGGCPSDTRTYLIASDAMAPALQVGDRVRVSSLAEGAQLPRGTVVVLRLPPGQAGLGVGDLIKRVIGLPGETIYSVNSRVYIDGKPLSEPWLARPTPIEPPVPRTVIPTASYYVLGDNRSNSRDSRNLGPVPYSEISGAVCALMPSITHQTP
jgi:signal peptidase I